MIVERTQEGKALAKQRDDFREGRPRKTHKVQVQHALELLKNHTYKEVEEMTGIKKRTLINRKNELKAKRLTRDSSRGSFYLCRRSMGCISTFSLGTYAG